MHECFAEGCTAQIPRRMLMCRSHWFKVPAEIRREVWRTWDNGRGISLREYAVAIRKAKEAVAA